MKHYAKCLKEVEIDEKLMVPSLESMEDEAALFIGVLQAQLQSYWQCEKIVAYFILVM